MNSPTEEHLGVVNRILWYLKMTPAKGLFSGKTTRSDVEVFIDAN